MYRRAASSDEDYNADDLAEIASRLTAEEKALRNELETAPIQAVLKHLERRYTTQGRAYLTEPKEDEEVKLIANEKPVGWQEKFALTAIRQFDEDNRRVTRTSLQVNSPALKALLGDIIGSKYPGVPFKTKSITIDFPLRCLLHYRPELKAALTSQEPGSQGESHLPILLDFIDEHFADELEDLTNLLPQGLISYKHLWTLFKPGDLVLSGHGGQRRVSKLDRYEYQTQPGGLRLYTDFTEYDGDFFGKQIHTLFIPQFSGTAPIAALTAMPLARHSDAAAITARLIERGRRWEALVVGQNLVEYKGLAVDPKGDHYNIEGRVMLDTQTFQRIEAREAFNVHSPFPKIEPPAAPSPADGPTFTTLEKTVQNDPWANGSARFDDEIWKTPVPKKDLAPLTDTQCLLATPIVRGFCFTEKKFLDFQVDHTHPIAWNGTCFDQLVLPTQQKELVQALVAEHTSKKSNQFDDIVKGKGKGLVLVLHGPPGVGKTLTAECVAEFCRRPLYIVSSGDLGTNPSDLDQRLTRTLDLASTWKAILLIDEADVFLEQRSLHDLNRNSLVSIFLRTLEYYSGILFMTTNRVRTFDDAFKSRIHVPLKYSPLPVASRLLVWENFLAKLDNADELDLDEEGLRALAEAPLNGRQIKNVVRTAKSLANYKGKRLDREQLEQVMEIQMEFERDLGGFGVKEKEDVDMQDR